MAGNDETVAAVVAFSAKEDDVLAVPAVKPGTGPFGHGVAGIFHEDSRSMAYTPCMAIRSIFRI